MIIFNSELVHWQFQISQLTTSSLFNAFYYVVQ